METKTAQTERTAEEKMPVDLKHLKGPTSHSKAELSQAVKEGERAYSQGKEIKDCPSEFRPRMGDSALYDKWVMGFKGARIAEISRIVVV